MSYNLDKKIWSDKDFEQMGWHDCHIYKIRVAHDLELDIDYIFQWNKPELEGLPFTFWITPATLVFRLIKNLTFELDTSFEDTIEIERIGREITDDGVSWTIVTQQGDIMFLSESFQRFIRQDPFYEFGQTISFIERGGFSLEQTTNQNNPNRYRDDLVELRKKDLENYENVKKRHLKRKEQEELNETRANNGIETKQYLLRKKEVKESLDYYDYCLKDTRFENW